jgi:dTDP-4-amino-4,6-dideoxygalactose transaminase
MDKMIPFNKPYVPEASKRYVMEALESDHQQGDGPFTKRASKMVSDLVGGGHVLLTPSCTHALEMASMLGNFGPGDEVILPSYTFTSAATAVTKFGATPVFVDIDPVTKGIDANQVAEAVTDRTIAISWVNYAGVAPDIEALQSISREHNLLLIEDNAHGLGGSYRGKPLGSFGDFATQSFHATKNIQCGEGGALVINSHEFIERAEIIREKGTDRSKFVRGEVQKYQWVDQGSSYLLAESLAAILCGQLENYKSIQTNRKNITEIYSKIRTPNDITFNSHDANSVAHMFYLKFTNESIRHQFMTEMLKLQITTSTHYQPLQSSIFALKNKIKSVRAEISEEIAKTLVRLPLWHELPEVQTTKIVHEVNSFMERIKWAQKV